VPRAVRVTGVETSARLIVPSGIVVRPPRGPVRDVIGRHLRIKIDIDPGVSYVVHNQSVRNLLRAVIERVMYIREGDKLVSTPQPVRFFSKMERVLRKLSWRSHFPPVWSREMVINSYVGDRRKQVRYTNAASSLLENPLTQKDARVDAFGKREKIKRSSSKPDPVPSCIQPRKPRFLLESGRYFKPLETLVYKEMGNRLYGEPCVSKGFNAVDSAELLRRKWDRFHRPVCVGMDASRFDQHVSVDALRWTHQVYKSYFRNDKYFSDMLSWMIENRGVAYARDGSFSYSVRGRRMSGDMDTALGNCLLMCSMVWTYCTEKKIKHQVLNNGDDIVVVMESHDLPTFNTGLVKWFKEMGFTMVVEEPVYNFEEIEFCQCQPVWNGENWVFCRGPNSISKDLHCLVSDDPEVWIRAVGLCGLALNRGVPVLQEVSKWMIRVGRDSNVSSHPGYSCGMIWMAKGLLSKEREVTEEARHSFYLAYGILPDMQREIEREFSKLGVIENRYGQEEENPTKDSMYSMHYSSYYHPCRGSTATAET